MDKILEQPPAEVTPVLPRNPFLEPTANIDAVSADVQRIREILGNTMPQSHVIRRYRPNEEWFEKQDHVTEKRELHGVFHIARVMILQELLSRVRMQRGIPLDQIAIRWAAATHDIARGGPREFDHGVAASEWVKRNLDTALSHETLEKIMYIDTWHEAENERIPRMTEELATCKDADALDLVRTGLDIADFKLRTLEAQTYFPRIAKRLYELSVTINTGDPFEDVILAAERMGLLESDRDVDVFEILKSESAYLLHGLRGNIDKSVRETFQQMLKRRELCTPIARRDEWSEAEKLRYAAVPGDAVRIYTYLGNQEIGIAGGAYIGDGIFIAIPTRSPALNGVVVGEDQDRGREVPVHLGRLNGQGRLGDVEIPLRDTIMVMSDELLWDTLPHIIDFCNNDHLDPTQWIPSHIVISRYLKQDQDYLFRRMNELCQQTGQPQLTTVTAELKHGSKEAASQHIRIPTADSRVIDNSPSSVRFRVGTLDTRVQQSFEKLLAKTRQNASVGSGDWLKAIKLYETATAVNDVFGLHNQAILEEMKGSIDALRELENKLVWVGEGDSRYIDASPILKKMYPNAMPGGKVKSFGEVTYVFGTDGKWKQDLLADL